MSFLTSDEAVVAFQKYFGVVSIGNSASEKHCNDTSRHSENNGLDANRVTSPGHTYRLRNRVIPLQQQKDSASQKIETEQAHTNGIILDYEIRSYFWFYLFTFGAALANEVFFMIFLPLCCWNVTMLLPRRIVYTWMILFYLGQGSKDVVKIPRPTSPPVIRLDTTQVYMKEYGMPSTHAMLGIGLIGTIMYTFVEQYEFPVIPALVICFLWVALVCASRLYLGMHNVMDIVIGLIFAAVLMAIYVPFFDVLDDYFAFHPNVVWNVAVVTIFTTLVYPDITEMNASRELTTTCCGTSAGFLIGAWCRLQYGIHPLDPVTPPPYAIPPLELSWFLQATVRTAVGLVLLFLTRTLTKITFNTILSVILRVPYTKAKKTDILLVELSRKYMPYFVLSFSAVFLYPMAYEYFNMA